MSSPSGLAGWVEADLGELLQFNYGKALPDRVRSGHGFPVFGSNGIVGYHDSALTSGETLVIGRKGSVGEISFSPGPCSPIDTTYYIDQFYGMSSRFWFYLLKHLRLGDLNKATAIPGLNREDAYRVLVPVPPLNEQKRIADKLDALLARVDSCRERLDRVPLLLKRFRQAVLAAATSGQLTEEWEHGDRREQVSSRRPISLEDACIRSRVITYGVIKLGNEHTDGVPCLRTSNVRWLNIDTRGMKRIDPRLSEAYHRTVLQGNEVLVNVRGTLGGVAAVEPSMVGWNVSREVAVVPIDPNIAHPRFVALWIASNTAQAWLTRVQKGVAYIGINIEDLRSLPLDLPSTAEQQEIVRRVESLFGFADRLEAHYNAARAQVECLTPVLLAKAFRGELVPQDPNDEPASMLLERIRAARAVAEETRAKPRQRQAPATSDRKSKAEVIMLKRKDIQPSHLSAILKTRGPLTAEALWSTSQLEIDDFYDQLKDEEASDLLKETRKEDPNASRLLEAA